MRTLSPGTIISGTLRDQDVIPALLDALESVNPIESADLRIKYADVIAADYDYAVCGDAVSWLCDAVYDALQSHAPDGFTVGSHPGDGADIGVWACREED